MRVSLFLKEALQAVMKQTQKIALSGLMTALAAVVLILSNIVPIGLYTFPAAAGIIIYILTFTVGRSYAWASYGAVSLLSLFLCADREASLCFVCFLGFYPLLKELLEKLPKVLAYAAKVLLFNAAAVSVYCLVTRTHFAGTAAPPRCCSPGSRGWGSLCIVRRHAGEDMSRIPDSAPPAERTGPR